MFVVVVLFNCKVLPDSLCDNGSWVNIRVRCLQGLYRQNMKRKLSGRHNQYTDLLISPLETALHLIMFLMAFKRRELWRLNEFPKQKFFLLLLFAICMLGVASVLVMRGHVQGLSMTREWNRTIRGLEQATFHFGVLIRELYGFLIFFCRILGAVLAPAAPFL